MLSSTANNRKSQILWLTVKTNQTRTPLAASCQVLSVVEMLQAMVRYGRSPLHKPGANWAQANPQCLCAVIELARLRELSIMADVSAEHRGSNQKASNPMSCQTLRWSIRQRGSGRTMWLLVAFVSLVLTLTSPAVIAQQVPTPTLDQINAVARELYCPLCNGVRLDTCELQACIQMRQVISDKLAEGVSKEQIKQEFVAEYGPKVLGEPPRSGLDLLAWIVPIAAIIAGAAWLLYTARRWSRQPEVVPASAPAAGGTEAETTAATASTDAYLAQVETDLANLE